MSVSDDEESDGGDWNSGPFCRHWCDPGDCDECAVLCRCGHAMRAHEALDGEEAGACDECDCPRFTPAG